MTQMVIIRHFIYSIIIIIVIIIIYNSLLTIYSIMAYR